MNYKLKEDNSHNLNQYDFDEFLKSHFESSSELSAASDNDSSVKYEIAKIPGDASMRHYYRVIIATDNNSAEAQTYILMDSSKEPESVKPFLKVARILLAHGFNAPDIIAEDLASGYILLQDFGDNIFAKAINEKNESDLYRLACDNLLKIQSRIKVVGDYDADNSRANNLDIPKYTTQTYINESNLFFDWYIPQYDESATSAQISKLKNEFADIFEPLLENLSNKYQHLVLRDYHAENLIYLDDVESDQMTEKLATEKLATKKLGLLDFQDALIGHKAYDLMSLLEDARRNVSDIIQQDILNYYSKALSFSAEQKDKFLQDYYILAAQRNMKILGIFCRLNLRDNKPKYLDLIPRVRDYLLNDLEKIGSKELSEFLFKKCGL